MFEKVVTEKFLKALEQIDYGSLDVSMPNGKLYQFHGHKQSVHATLKVNDWRAIHALAAKGDIGFAEAYREGWWDSDDLTNLFLVGLQNEAALNPYIYGGVIGRIAARISYIFKRNTMSGSKKNIHAHYDIGNDFYQLWLDETMTYSSAIFRSPSENLVQAQHNKYDRILDKLHHSGRVLEVGCGWGGFAERAVHTKDLDIKGLTISNEQHAFASKRLGKNAHIALEDYRIQQGKYDHIVSIEMFEAVGEHFWNTYFTKIKSLLADKGKAVIQTITIGNDYFDRYRTGGDVFRTFIFPGGMLPSPQRFAEESQKAGLRINDMYSFGQDYALTADHWLKRFENKLQEIKTLGFDEPFVRLWRFYLTCCIASFRVGRTDVMQVELAHA